MESAASLLYGFAPPQAFGLTAVLNAPSPTSLSPALPAAGSAYPPVSPLLLIPRVSIGISTDCPSPTPSGLSLGPDLPWADEPSPGNLRLSTVKILTLLSLLIPAFSLLFRPHVLPLMLLPATLRSPTNTSGTFVLRIPRLR